MDFSIEDSKKLNRERRFQYLSKYHEWIKKERDKDKKKLPYKNILLGQMYLRKDLCPYCKKKLKQKKEEDLIFKSCEKHGLLQIKKWNYWTK